MRRGIRTRAVRSGRALQRRSWSAWGTAAADRVRTDADVAGEGRPAPIEAIQRVPGRRPNQCLARLMYVAGRSRRTGFLPRWYHGTHTPRASSSRPPRSDRASSHRGFAAANQASDPSQACETRGSRSRQTCTEPESFQPSNSSEREPCRSFEERGTHHSWTTASSSFRSTFGSSSSLGNLIPCARQQ